MQEGQGSGSWQWRCPSTTGKALCHTPTLRVAKYTWTPCTRDCHLAGCAQLHTPTCAGALPCSSTAGGTHPPGDAQETQPATSALAAPVPSPLPACPPCPCSAPGLCRAHTAGQEPSTCRGSPAPGLWGPRPSFTFAHVACLVIVTELQSLIDASRGTAGNSGSEQTCSQQGKTPWHINPTKHPPGRHHPSLPHTSSPGAGRGNLSITPGSHTGIPKGSLLIYSITPTLINSKLLPPLPLGLSRGKEGIHSPSKKITSFTGSASELRQGKLLNSSRIWHKKDN